MCGEVCTCFQERQTKGGDENTYYDAQHIFQQLNHARMAGPFRSATNAYKHVVECMKTTSGLSSVLVSPVILNIGWRMSPCMRVANKVEFHQLFLNLNGDLMLQDATSNTIWRSTKGPETPESTDAFYLELYNSSRHGVKLQVMAKFNQRVLWQSSEIVSKSNLTGALQLEVGDCLRITETYRSEATTLWSICG